jgi:HK97 family phage portal protein
MKIADWAAATVRKAAGVLQAVDTRSSGGWWPIIREPFTGAWQRNITWSRETVLAHFAVYACINRIANDIGNMPWRITEVDGNGIWHPVDISSKSPVLRRPNRYQNDIQFRQWWAMSKLTHGNTYVLLGRDNRGEVVNEYILDPCGAQVLVSPDGSVFYQFQTDNLTGITESQVAIPASEIIHDRMNCLYHPLVGTSPLFACGASAALGLKMQEDSALFFSNGANPGGVLTAPGAISDETAKELKAGWNANYQGANAGKIAVLGDGLKFEAMRMNYRDAQLIEQLKFNAEMICSVYGVPPFKIGLGTIPAGMKVPDMELLYYNNALHTPIEEMERCQDDALKLDGADRRTELDTDTLLRMDPATFADVQIKLTSGAINTPNESRRALNKPPLVGGDTVYMQQQDFPLDQVRLNKIEPPAPVAAPVVEEVPNREDEAAKQMQEFMETLTKGLSDANS